MSKDKKEYGYEGEMAMTQLKAIMQHAEQLHDMLEPDTDLPEWVQSKITLAYDYIQTAADYMATELDEALVGNQHKIDANKNGKIDAHDFGLIRAKDGKPPFSEPYSRIKVHKDEYGNVIKNVAKRLAKKGMAANEDVESIDELSKGLVNRYMDKNYQDRKRLASGLWYPKGEAGATEKQKKDSAKLDKRVASDYLAHKKANPETWAKDNPPHLRGGDKPARVNATEEYMDENTKLYDAHFDKQTNAVQNRLNLHMRNGLTYPQAVEKTRKVGSSVKGCTPLKEKVESIDEQDNDDYSGIYTKQDKVKKWIAGSGVQYVREEAPTNAAGGGNIAGIGVGPKGEPGVKRSAMDKYKRKNAEGAPKAGRKTFSLFMKDE